MRLYLSSFRLGNQPEELLRLFVSGKRTAVILNADDYKPADDRAASLAREFANLERIGLEPTEIDLRSYFGTPTRLRDALAGFDGLWVRGGNVFILRRAFRQSGADDVVPELLALDALVYSGYSAGVDVLTPSLQGIELVDDPYLVPKQYEPEIIWEGLGIVPYAIAPHYRSDHPESADIERYVQHLVDHHVLFVALRDGQAIVRDGGPDRVVG